MKKGPGLTHERRSPIDESIAWFLPLHINQIESAF